MIEIVLLSIPLGLLIVGIVYFSVSLWNLRNPTEEYSSLVAKDPVPILEKIIKMIIKRQFEFLNEDASASLILDGEFVLYVIKSQDQMVVMCNEETQPKIDILKTPETLPQSTNQVARPLQVRESKSKGELLWQQN